MNKQLIIQKLAFITEEMQQQTKEWQSNGFHITNLEVDAFISNIKYLIEQAEFLNDLLLEAKESSAESLQSPVSSPQPVVDHSQEAPIPQPVINHVTPNAESEKIEAGAKQYEEPVAHAPELTTNNKQPITNNTESTKINEQYKSEQDSLLERLKKMHAEKSLGEQLKEKNAVKDFSFSLNERFFIINQVFNGNSDIFEGMISSIKELSSWNDAEQYLKTTYHHEYRWENKSTEIDHFFELIRERFNG